MFSGSSVAVEPLDAWREYNRVIQCILYVQTTCEILVTVSLSYRSNSAATPTVMPISLMTSKINGDVSRTVRRPLGFYNHKIIYSARRAKCNPHMWRVIAVRLLRAFQRSGVFIVARHSVLTRITLRNINIETLYCQLIMLIAVGV